MLLFSILIANYNNGRYLQQCINSILAQIYTNWEVVIVDDGSTDISKTIYQQYAYDIRFRIFFNDTNRGCGYTKHRCAELANGVLCGFVDPDDALSTDALDTMLKMHLDNPAASLIYSNHYICNEALDIIKIANYVGAIPPGKKSWEVRLPTISHFAVFRKDSYLRSHGIYQWLPKAVDKDLYFKLEETGDTLFVDKPLYYYRHHGGSISLHYKSSFANMLHISLKTLMAFRNPDTDKFIKRLPHTKMELAGSLVLSGIYILSEQKIKSGFNLIIKAYRNMPFASATAPFWLISRHIIRKITKNNLKGKDANKT